MRHVATTNDKGFQRFPRKLGSSMQHDCNTAAPLSERQYRSLTRCRPGSSPLGRREDPRPRLIRPRRAFEPLLAGRSARRSALRAERLARWFTTSETEPTPYELGRAGMTSHAGQAKRRGAGREGAASWAQFKTA